LERIVGSTGLVENTTVRNLEDKRGLIPEMVTHSKVEISYCKPTVCGFFHYFLWFYVEKKPHRSFRLPGIKEPKEIKRAKTLLHILEFLP